MALVAFILCHQKVHEDFLCTEVHRLCSQVIYEILAGLLASDQQDLLHDLWPRQMLMPLTGDAAAQCYELSHFVSVLKVSRIG